MALVATLAYGARAAPAATPAATDVVFVFDTTGSMSGALSEAKGQVSTVMANLSARLPNVQYGIAEMKDYGDTPVWRVAQGLTTDVALVQAAVDPLVASGGGDSPEGYVTALWQSDHDPAIGWRPGSKHLVVLIADDVPHDNDLNQGVPASIVTFGSPWGTGTDPGPAGTGLDWQAELSAFKADGFVFAYVLYHGASAYLPYWNWWAGLTGGSATESTGPLGDVLTEIVTSTATSPGDATKDGRLNVVVLGDSYSAGNGAPAYTGLDGCYRSLGQSWANRYIQWLKTRGHNIDNVLNRACSGATLGHVSDGDKNTFGDPNDMGILPRALKACTEAYRQSPDQNLSDEGPWRGPRGVILGRRCRSTLDPQWLALSQKTDLVIFSYGGDDLQFDEIVKQCFAPILQDPEGCAGAVKFADDHLQQVQWRLIEVLAFMRSHLRPDAKIVLLGYPHLVGSYPYVLKANGRCLRGGAHGGCGQWEHLEYDAGEAVRQLAENGAQAQAAAVDTVNAAAGVPFAKYVRVIERFAGHEPDPRGLLPKSNAWLSDLLGTLNTNEWYHPNTLGHNAYAQELMVQGSLNGGTGDFGASD